MTKKDKKLHEGPTPNLGKPKSDRQIFTYSENKLLDQITIELMEAWRKDLTMMKGAYNKTCEYAEKLESMQNALENIHSYLVEYDLPKIKLFVEKQENIAFFIDEIRKSILELEKKIDRSHTDFLLKIKDIKTKKWWKIWK